MQTQPYLDDAGQLVPTFGFLSFHAALRRDAARFVDATDPARPDHLGSEQRGALHARWTRYRALLEYHHDVEEEHLLPSVRQAAPELAGLIDQVGAEHQELHSVIGDVEEALAQLGDGAGAKRSHAAFQRLKDLLGPHLLAEEEHLVPVVVRMVAKQASTDVDTPAEGDAGRDGHGVDDSDQDAPADDESPVPDSFAHPWVIEGLPPEVTRLAVAALTEDEQARFEGWAAEYRAELDRWMQATRSDSSAD